MKTILVDLDGVLNQYKGNYDEKYIPPIKNGAFDFIKDISENYKIVLFTSRNLMLASKWVLDNGLEKYIDNVTNIKEPSFLIIDDRCINFNGDYEKVKSMINSFKTWYN